MPKKAIGVLGADTRIGTFKGRTIFHKGISNAVLYDADGNMKWGSTLADTAAVNYAVGDAGEIRAGVGSPLQISLPSQIGLTVTIDVPTSSMEMQAIATGNRLTRNAPAPIPINLTVANDKIIIPEGIVPINPVASERRTALIQGDAYLIEDDGAGEYSIDLSDSPLLNGENHCVYIWINKPAAQMMKFSTSAIPEISKMILEFPLYASPRAGDISNSTRIGTDYYVIPRAQPDGNLDRTADQTAHSVTSITFNALPYEDVAADNPCLGSDQSLAYLIRDIFEDTIFHAANAIGFVGAIVAEVGVTKL